MVDWLKQAKKIKFMYKMPVEELAKEIKLFDEYYKTLGLDPAAGNYIRSRRGWLMKTEYLFQNRVLKPSGGKVLLIGTPKR